MSFKVGNIPWNKGHGDYITGENNPMYGKRHSLETREKISKALMGNVPWTKGLTKETDSRIKTPPRAWKKGHIPWNKGVKVGKAWILKECKICHQLFEIRECYKNRYSSCQNCRKINRSWEKEKNPKWNGGISKINELIRGSILYKEWRRLVFKRDYWTCQICGKKGGNINADHIKPFSLYPELRFDINNGRTVCEDCHKIITFNKFCKNKYVYQYN